MPPAVCDSEHEIWCLAEGDDQPFPIYISSTKFIFNLQELVLAGCRKGYFYDADAKDLILMKVNINYLANQAQILTGNFQPNTHDKSCKLLDNPMEEIAQVWPTAPCQGYISVFVCSPSQTALGKQVHASDDLDSVCESKLLELSPSIMGIPSRYKSLQGEPSQKILDDRPEADTVPPPSLLYHGFGHFMDNIRPHKGIIHLDSTQHDLEINVNQFAEEMAKFYRDEDSRMTQGLKALEMIWGKPFIPASFGQVHANFGCYYGPHNAMTCIVKFQNEPADIYSMAMVELTGYIAYSHKQSLNQYGALFKGWNVPCLGLTVVGPYVTFYGVIFLGQWRVVSLTPTLSCIVSASEGGERMALYAAFSAALDLLHRIDQDAQHFVHAPPIIPHADRKFPYVSELPNYHTPNEKFQFQILRRHPHAEDYRHLYIAQTSDKKEVVVKFTRRYSIALHAFCAKCGHAPGILGFGTIPGGWFVVAMDYILPSVYPSQSRHLLQLRDKWIGDLMMLVKSFHDEGLVHGDLREPNMICDEEEIMLVDFDWGGTAGQVSYPRADLNPELTDGRASTNAEITIGDDIRILQNTVTKLRNVKV